MQRAQVEADRLGLASECIELGVLVDGDDGGRKGGGGPDSRRWRAPILSGMTGSLRVVRVVTRREAEIVWAGGAHMAVGWGRGKQGRHVLRDRRRIASTGSLGGPRARRVRIAGRSLRCRHVEGYVLSAR